MLSDLAKTLDFKCHVVDKASALMKELADGTYESIYVILVSNVTFSTARARWLHFLNGSRNDDQKHCLQDLESKRGCKFIKADK